MTMTDRRDGATDARTWWKSAVVYQVYPRSFADADGDGVGDLAGLRSRLDHLERLGVDVIWLSPIYASPQADNGYDISDYRCVDPTYGTLDDFDELLAEIHARGMRLLMDLVVNHTSDQHPWFQESRSSVGDPKRDWYWWRPPRPGSVPGAPGAEPNNWASFFSGPAWTFDEQSGEYYLHLFDRGQPDLNWENPEVRGAVYDVMRWWLDRGVDGFRMDVINFISKDVALPDAPVRPHGLGDGFPYFATGPRIHEFLQEMHREVFDGRDRELLTVGEMPGVTWQDAVLFTDPARRELDMVFQFEHVGLDVGPGGKFDPQPFDLRKLKASLGRWQRGLAEVGWNSLYLNNHDQPRAVSRFGNDREHWRESATALATVLHLLRGTPFVYQGEELGMTNAPFESIDELRDVESLNHVARAVAADEDPGRVLDALRRMSRDNARTPMQWDAGYEAGFTSGVPWIAVNPNHRWLNARAQYDDPGSVFHHYRSLIRLRHSMPVVVEGDFVMLLPDHPQLFAYDRTLGDVRLTVVANLSDTAAVTVWERPWRDPRLLLTNLAAHCVAERTHLGGDGVGRLVLQPWEARVYLDTTG